MISHLSQVKGIIVRDQGPPAGHASVTVTEHTSHHCTREPVMTVLHVFKKHLGGSMRATILP